MSVQPYGNGGWHFRLLDRDRAEIADSTVSYSDREAAADGVDALTAYGTTMAESTRTYANRTDAREAMNDVKAQAPDGWITFTE